MSKDTFVKHLVCEHIKGITPGADAISAELQDELASLAQIKLHAIITTNYDMFLESVFDGYETITGQKILKYNTNSFGEIFHVHGDVSTPRSLVLTQNDYSEWTDKKKYVSAKLLTYFAEHPVFIFGYGLGDDNVKAILRDIGELVADEDGLIPNVFQVIWHAEKIEKNPRDQAVFSFDGREFRTRAIHTTDLQWIFDALRNQSTLTSINPKLVRALAARTMKLIRHDIPTGSVSVDYNVLERVANESDHLPTLLGLTIVDNPNQSHPFTIGQIATRIGLPNWQAVNKLINRIKMDKQVDLRSSDNKYHCRIKTGSKDTSAARKWSHFSIDLFQKVKEGLPYEITV